MKAYDEKSIMDMCMGAFKERVDYEMTRVIQNILDQNTHADKKRQIIVTLDIIPSADRERVNVSALVKSKLAPTCAVMTQLYITDDTSGNFSAIEMTPQIPGQRSLTDSEQPEPNVLRLIREA